MTYRSESIDLCPAIFLRTWEFSDHIIERTGTSSLLLDKIIQSLRRYVSFYAWTVWLHTNKQLHTCPGLTRGFWILPAEQTLSNSSRIVWFWLRQVHCAADHFRTVNVDHYMRSCYPYVPRAHHAWPCYQVCELQILTFQGRTGFWIWLCALHPVAAAGRLGIHWSDQRGPHIS